MLQSTGIKVLASGVARKLNERVFTADVSPCAAFDGHDDDAVENDLGLLGSADGIVIIGLANGVAAIGDHDHDLAPAALLQRSRPQVKSVIEGRRGPGPNVVNGAVDHSNIGSERCYLVNNLAELKQGQAIDGTQDGVREAARGFQFELGRAYLGLGRWDAAGQHVAKANQLRPDDPQQHVVLGNIMLRERNADGALKEFQEALRLDPKGPIAEPTRQVIARIEAAIKQPK